MANLWSPLPLLSSSSSSSFSFSSSPLFLLSSKAFAGPAREALVPPPRSSLIEEFGLPDAPLEPTLPKFNRLPHSESLSPTPPTSPDSEPLATPTPRRRRRGRSYKASPWQTIPGALIGGLCALATFNGSFSAYSHLTLHPLAHNLPLGLASEVNSFLLMMLKLACRECGIFLLAFSTVLGFIMTESALHLRSSDRNSVIWFGGLAVCMFGVSSVGLTLLSVKLLSQEKPPS